MDVEKRIETMVGKLNARLATMPDPELVDGISPKSRAMLHEDNRVTSALVRDIERARRPLARPVARLALEEQFLADAMTARGTLEQQHAEALAALARRERGASVQSLGELEASLEVLERGAEYLPGGEPALPGPLWHALAGRWHGSIPALERRVAELKQEVSELQARLQDRLREAERYLERMLSAAR
jgi:hypothetical protein